MTLFDFINAHPFMSLFALLLLFACVEDLIKAWRGSK